MPDCRPRDSEICKQVEKYNHGADVFLYIYRRFALVADSIILLSSLLVIYRVVVIHKRKDWFLFWTPMFYLLFAICYVI